MYVFNKNVYEIIKARQMKDASENIHKVCSFLGAVLNQAQNYVYWKNERLGNKHNPEAVHCYLALIKALHELHEDDQLSILITFEKGDNDA
jgi:hypothetical protein